MDEIGFGPRTALVAVDVQNDFADPAGSLYVAGGEEVVPLITDTVRKARAAGAAVFYTADWHPETTPHFAKDGGIWPVHCVAGTWGAQFHPGLLVDGPVVRKGANGEDGYSGFTMRDPSSQATVPTDLARLLRERGTIEFILCGLATDYCVKSTALDGLTEGFAVQVLVDAVRSVDLQQGDGGRALSEVEQAGAVLLGGSHRS
jgi:nicotinamidase/pyrazinamidase